MSFYIKPYIDQAKKLVKEGNAQSVIYAALELRIGIEIVAYEALRLRLGNASIMDFEKKWRPKDVLVALEELVDPNIGQDATLRASPNDDNGHPTTWTSIGTRKGLDVKLLHKLWQNLSNFLHVGRPSSKNERIEPYHDFDKVRKSIVKIIAFLEGYENKIDFHFGDNVSFTCDCGFSVQRTRNTLMDGMIVKCVDPECRMEWVTKITGEAVTFQAHSQTFECLECGTKNYVDIGTLRSLRPYERTCITMNCGKCEARHQIWGALQYRLVPAE